MKFAKVCGAAYCLAFLHLGWCWVGGWGGLVAWGSHLVGLGWFGSDRWKVLLLFILNLFGNSGLQNDFRCFDQRTVVI